MIRPIDLTAGPGRASPLSVSAVPPSPPPSTSFTDVLGAELNGTGRMRFSAHAQRRLDSREVTLTGADHARLDKAVDELARKGSRESLVLMDRVALVVNVPNRTVITAVPQGEANPSVFTHIDSAVVLPREA